MSKAIGGITTDHQTLARKPQRPMRRSDVAGYQVAAEKNPCGAGPRQVEMNRLEAEV